MSTAVYNSVWPEFIEQYLTAWELLHKSVGGSPDLSPSWHRALLIGQNISVDELFVLYSQDGNNLSLVLPYRIRDVSGFGIRYRIGGPLQNEYCMHSGVLSSMSIAAVSNVLIEGLDMSDRWDIWEVNSLAKSSDSDDCWNAFREKNQLRGLRTPAATSPFLRPVGGWAGFLSSKSSNFRYNLRRKRRKLEKLGKLRIEFVTDAANFAGTFESICAIERRSWKQAAGSAITSPSRPWELEFYRCLLPALLERDQAIITFLYLDDRPVAHDISSRTSTRGFCLKTSFVAELASASPGIVLREALVEHLFSGGASEYDFLGGGERYKLEWATGTRPAFDVSLYGRTTAGTTAFWKRRLMTLFDKRTGSIGDQS